MPLNKEIKRNTSFKLVLFRFIFLFVFFLIIIDGKYNYYILKDNGNFYQGISFILKRIDLSILSLILI